MVQQHKTILLSGGIDSAASIAASSDDKAALSTLFIDYGQPAANSEWMAARQIAGYFDVPVRRLDLGFDLVSTSGEFFARNALFVLAAAAVTEDRPLAIVLGIHALAQYYDTTPLFVDHLQRLLDGYSAGTVFLSVPFLTATKADIVRYSHENNLPLALTYSCERKNAPACGDCPSCQDRRVLDVE